MTTNADMKLHLIIEAINRTNTAWAEFQRDVNQAVRGTDQLTATGAKTGKVLDEVGNKGSQGLKQVHDSALSLKNVLGALFTGVSIAYFSKQILDAGLAMERFGAMYKAVFQGEALAAREMAFAAEQAKRLGLEVQSVSQAYGKFSAATRNTSIEGQPTRDIFVGVAEAVTALKLSTEEANGIFLALSQMVSKGKVSAEEMNGQLGERLPGALKLAADAMGMTTAELMKQMEQGEIMASELLPKLAEELHKTYGKAATEAAEQGQGAINRFNNSIFETKAKVGEAAMPAMTSLLNTLTPLITTFNKLAWGAEAFGISVEAMAHNVVTAIKYMTPGSGVGSDEGLDKLPFFAAPFIKFIRNYQAYRGTVNQDTAAAETLIQERASFWDTGNTTPTAKSRDEIETEAKRNAERKAKEAAANRKAIAIKEAAELKRVLADLDTAYEKAQWEDKGEQKKADIRNRYADLMAKYPADRAKFEERMNRDLQQAEEEQWADWEKEQKAQEKKKTAAAEKIRDALRVVDEQIADHAVSELDRQLAAQDKFYFESLEKLQDAGMAFEDVVAKEPEIFEAAQKKKLQILNTYNNQRRQAELNMALSHVDYQERDRTISKDTAATERVKLTRELLALQVARLEQLAQEGQKGSEAWNSQAAAIQATRARLFELTELLKERSGTFTQGMIEGLQRYHDQALTFYQQGLNMAQATATGMEQAFSDGFFDVMETKFNNLGDYVLNFLRTVQRAIANFLAQQATNAIISNIGSWATSMFGSYTGSSGGGGGVVTMQAHEGGLIPRFHFGGLASDEVPAVLLRRERVLSREQNELFERFANKTDNHGSNFQLNVRIENKTSDEVKVRDLGGHFDGKQYVKNVVFELLRTSPEFRSMVRG